MNLSNIPMKSQCTHSVNCIKVYYWSIHSDEASDKVNWLICVVVFHWVVTEIVICDLNFFIVILCYSRGNLKMEHFVWQLFNLTNWIDFRIDHGKMYVNEWFDLCRVYDIHIKWERMILTRGSVVGAYTPFDLCLRSWSRPLSFILTAYKINNVCAVCTKWKYTKTPQSQVILQNSIEEITCTVKKKTNSID